MCIRDSCSSRRPQPLFERFGDVGDIYLPKDRESGRSARPLANHSENKS